MKRYVFVLLAAVGLGACAAPGGVGNHTVLIIGNDDNAGSVARTSRVHTRTLNKISSSLDSYGFKVFDESTVTADTHTQGRSRRSNAELIDIAQSIRNPPIDTAALFTIYKNITNVGYTKKLNVRIEGRLLDVHGGGHQGNFEVSETSSIRPGCQGPCEVEAVGNLARVLAAQVGSELADRLGARVKGLRRGRREYLDDRRSRRDRDDDGLITGYTLVFDDFSDRQIHDIEEYLVIFRGYKAHSPTTSFSRRIEFYYESSIARARLLRNLRRALEELDIRARVNFSGNEYTLRQVRFRERRKMRRRDNQYRW